MQIAIIRPDRILANPKRATAAPDWFVIMLTSVWKGAMIVTKMHLALIKNLNKKTILALLASAIPDIKVTGLLVPRAKEPVRKLCTFTK